MLIFLVVYLVISYNMFVVHGQISVSKDTFVQLSSYSFASSVAIRNAGIFEQIKMDEWMDVTVTRQCNMTLVKGW